MSNSAASPKNALAAFNAEVHQRVLAVKAEVEQRRCERGYVTNEDYLLQQLVLAIQAEAEKLLPTVRVLARLSVVDRAQFKADFCITCPGLLKEFGNRHYIAEIVPLLIKAVEQTEFAKCRDIVEIESKGIYVNLRLSESALFRSLAAAIKLGDRYGEVDALRGRQILVDYSSPNAAKTLHAGHIRSTIQGEVLCNICEAAGANVYRVNHINDLGGFGFLLEGYHRWKDRHPAAASDNERLTFLYLIRRSLEKIAEEGSAGSLTAEQRDTLRQYFGECALDSEYLAKFREYVDASNRRFESLEHGDPEEVTLWQQMVNWSLKDFDQFYRLLGIRHDFTIGESFFPDRGLRVVQAGLKSGLVFQYSEELCAVDVARYQEESAAGKISEEICRRLIEEARKDIGAYVVALEDRRRVIVLRRDGRTIYCTRDIGAVEYRTTVFNADAVFYVVGQEQNEHFTKMFEAAKKLGVVPLKSRLEHVGFGFYVAAATKKKLSSRDGASNVIRLLNDSIAFFGEKYKDSTELSAAEKEEVARQLALGSIIFNDLRKDRKSNIEIPAEIRTAIEDFERSGGAYVMYAACRAGSILRKHNGALPTIETVTEFELNESEVRLLKRLLEFPNKVTESYQLLGAVPLLNHLLGAAQEYNSYYNACPVIKGGEIHKHRLLITAAVEHMLRNGLRFCGIQCPERI